MRAKLGTCLNASVRVSTLQGQKPNTELILMHTVLGQICYGWGMVWEEGMRQGEHLWGVVPKISQRSGTQTICQPHLSQQSRLTINHLKKYFMNVFLDNLGLEDSDSTVIPTKPVGTNETGRNSVPDKLESRPLSAV
jgi:hypothetical protein